LRAKIDAQFDEAADQSDVPFFQVRTTGDIVKSRLAIVRNAVQSFDADLADSERATS
jgi:hypothetical protein